MKAGKKSVASDRLYMAMDIGGTNILAALVDEAGMILRSEKTLTPRGDDSHAVVAAIEKVIEDVMQKAGIDSDDLAAVGIAVPGVVDPKRGYVAITPNLCLGGVSLGPLLQERFKTPVTLGNDGNLGALGETWLGARENRKARFTFAWAPASAPVWCCAENFGAGARNGRGNRAHDHADRRPQMRLRKPGMPRNARQPDRGRTRHPRGDRRGAQEPGRRTGRRRLEHHPQRRNPQGPGRLGRIGVRGGPPARRKCWATLA